MQLHSHTTQSLELLEDSGCNLTDVTSVSTYMEWLMYKGSPRFIARGKRVGNSAQ